MARHLRALWSPARLCPSRAVALLGSVAGAPPQCPWTVGRPWLRVQADPELAWARPRIGRPWGVLGRCGPRAGAGTGTVVGAGVRGAGLLCAPRGALCAAGVRRPARTRRWAGVAVACVWCAPCRSGRAAAMRAAAPTTSHPGANEQNAPIPGRATSRPPDQPPDWPQDQDSASFLRGNTLATAGMRQRDSAPDSTANTAMLFIYRVGVARAAA